MRGAAALVLLCGCRGLLGIDGIGDQPPPDVPGDPPDPNPDVPSNACPAEFVPVGPFPHRYLKVTGPDNYISQLTDCAAFGSTIYLAIPDDADEMLALDVLAQEDFWVGIDDRQIENQFVTVKGTPATFLPWANGEPNNLNGSQDCVRARAQSTEIVDDDCDNTLPAVCECEP